MSDQDPEFDTLAAVVARVLDALREAGFALVKVGNVPPWMERHGSWYEGEHIQAWTTSEDRDDAPGVTPMFRLRGQRCICRPSPPQDGQSHSPACRWQAKGRRK